MKVTHVSNSDPIVADSTASESNSSKNESSGCVDKSCSSGECKCGDTECKCGDAECISASTTTLSDDSLQYVNMPWNFLGALHDSDMVSALCMQLYTYIQKLDYCSLLAMANIVCTEAIKSPWNVVVQHLAECNKYTSVRDNMIGMTLWQVVDQLCQHVMRLVEFESSLETCADPAYQVLTDILICSEIMLTPKD